MLPRRRRVSRIYLTLTNYALRQVRRQNRTAPRDAVVRETKPQGSEERGDGFVAAVFDHRAVTCGGIHVG